MTRGAACQLMGATAIIVFCALAQVPLERDPVTHVLVQLPLLAVAGWLIAGALRERIANKLTPRDHGVSGLLIALFAIAYWMLPRSIDAALESNFFELSKFISIPMLIGAPLALSWPRAHPLVRGFLKANALSMLGVLAFLYIHAPVRICNNYLVSDQERLGFGFLYMAIVLAVLWAAPLFFGDNIFKFKKHAEGAVPEPFREDATA